ncbi:MAG: rhomboid family intramembrane serine protease [Elusimicrobia bacterium]|nr:MAG: rhomboid family intramembrane serine protease [Elusimicrobiota bacterium]
MFPIRDSIPSRTTPFFTYALIGVNIAVFIHELRIGENIHSFINTYALIPASWTPTTIVSSMFLHGGWTHMLGNIWSLWIFGDNVEDRLGHFRYLAFYFFCGVMAGVGHLLSNLGSIIPTLGASGAIAGVMGAYFILYPRAKVLTVFPIFIIPIWFEIPAVLYLGLWFFTQLRSGLGGLGPEFEAIAWWAHIGGFVAGIYFVVRFVKRK